MAGQREDYLLRELSILRHLVARLLGRRDPAGIEEALQLSFHLQEKLFAMPPADFLRLPVSEQIKALSAKESAVAGRDKCLTYAGLLRETATIYQVHGRDDLAAGARQLALDVALHVALDGDAGAAQAGPTVEQLAAALDPEQLHEPVRAMLAEYRARQPS